MLELHPVTLKNALAQMPVYEAPAGLWEAIEVSLETEAAIDEKMVQLPVYEPPAMVWQNLEKQLVLAKKPNPMQHNRWLQYAAAAVFAGLLAAVSWWVFRLNYSGEPEVAIITTTQQTLDPKILEAVNAPEDDAFLMVQNLCKAQAPVCQQPEFLALKTALDELTAAKASLRQALGQYADDPEMVAQLIDIERERTQLLQALVQMI